MLLSTILVGVTALATGVGALSKISVTTTASSSSISTSTSTSTSSSAGATHSISVGAEGYKFSPNEVTNASIGDIIEFRFYPTGHSVVRSEYKLPCVPYEDTGPNKIGFFSGFVEVATITNNGPTFSVRVNDTQPIFFYCAAPGSCIDNYMIGVINPNETETLDVQLAYTKNTTMQLSPGDPLPSETAAAGSTSQPTSSASSAAGGSAHPGTSLSGGAIAGIAIGGAIVVLLAAALIYLCGRRGGLDKAYTRQGRGARHSAAAPPPPMIEAKYDTASAPKSPGQETYATTAYSTTPSNDPYMAQQLQHGVPGYSVGSASPPPVSVHSHSSYQHFGAAPGVGGGPLVDLGTGQAGFFTPQHTGPPPHLQQQNLHASPVELPTSKDPGSSPLPGYSNSGRIFSWSTGGEGNFQPWKPA